MLFWKWLFFASCAIIIYNYGGYVLLVYLWGRIRPLPRLRPAAAGALGAAPGAAQPPGAHSGAARADAQPAGAHSGAAPTVSFIVAAYNEEDFIRTKLINSLEQDYDPRRIEWIFVTDGSSDATAAIVGEYPRVRLLHQDQRRGKTAALNRAVAEARFDILIISDANTLLNREAVALIAGHYADPLVGGVAGEKKVIPLAGQESDKSAGEGLYWKYESFLKKTDSAFYSVVGAAGELFSLRRSLYAPVEPAVVLDDFVISLRVAQKGYRVLYEPGAYAMETPSFSIGDERKRKIRIAAGGFQAIGLLLPLLQFHRHPRLTFLYISHRVLRWVASPFCLVLALVSGGVLAFSGGGAAFTGGGVFQAGGAFFQYLFLAQAIFYGMALAALVVPAKGPGKILKVPYYFLFMNLSVLGGFARFLRGKQPAAWEKAKRAGAVSAS